MRNSIVFAALFLVACPTSVAKNGDNAQFSDDADNASDVVSDTPVYDGVVLADSFEQGCTFDSDCVLVGQGDLCLCAPCEDASIATAALPTYDAVRASITCESEVDPLIRCENDCAMLLPVCANQQCDAREPKFITGDMYRNDCTDAADCVLISTGEVCSVCRCGTAAIHIDDVTTYQMDTDVECSPPTDVECNCEPATEVDCVEQKCVVVAP